MQTIGRDTAAIAAPGPDAAVRGRRVRRIVAGVAGLAAFSAAAAGIVALGDYGTDAPSDPPITQVVPFVSIAPSGSGGSSADG